MNLAVISRTAAIYEALKEEILDGEHAPGRKLGIDQLAGRFKVSPGAVREALSRLTSDRLVLSMPQRGFVVATVSRKDLIDLTEVRIEIETRCLRRSIERGTLEWEGRLLGVWHQLSCTTDIDNPEVRRDWSRLHAAFHDELLACCDSQWWLHLRENLYMQAERYRRMMPRHALGSRDINAEHGAILEHTLQRDTARACTALRDHLSLTTDILLKTAEALVEEVSETLVAGE